MKRGPFRTREEQRARSARHLALEEAACDALEKLVGIIKRGDHEHSASATLEAQRAHPALAELLHQESVKLPTGASGLALQGGVGMQGGTLRELARQVLHVQKAAPKATKKITKKPAKSPKKAKVAKADKPKREPGPYMKFCKAERPKIVAANPKFTFGEVGKELGAKWRGMTDAQKAKYK